MTDIPVPPHIFDKLKSGLVSATADNVIRDHLDGGPVLHVGGLFGPVLAWLWRWDRDSAMLMLADYLAELFIHGHNAGQIDPPLTFEDAMTGIQFGMPTETINFDEFVEYARERVPSYYPSVVEHMT